MNRSLVFRSACAASLAIGLAAIAACSDHDRQAAQSSADDALIAAQVRARAAAIDPATVGLVKASCDRGVVTLRGKIATIGERTAVENAARQVGGVTRVQDDIVVDSTAPTGAQMTADLTLAAKVRTALAAQTGINAARIGVDVHRGVVTLTGTLPSQAHRTVVDETVHAVHGVTSVVDKITIAGS